MSKLIKSIIGLVVTLILFVSTIYAWFISNTTVTADNITGSVIEAQGGGVEIISSSITDEANKLYPYQNINFVLRAKRHISKLVIDFEVTSLDEADYYSAFLNHSEYTIGKYNYVKNGHSYNYEIEDSKKIDLLWQLSQKNKIEDFFTGELELDETKSTLVTENNQRCFIDLNITSGTIFNLNVMLGDLINEKYPSLIYDDYQIEASNFNCYMLGTSVKLIFTVEGA